VYLPGQQELRPYILSSLYYQSEPLDIYRVTYSFLQLAETGGTVCSIKGQFDSRMNALCVTTLK